MLRISEQEKEELRVLMRRAQTPHVRVKAIALWNLAQGKKRREVADLLGVSVVSLTNWTKRFKAEGFAGLVIRPGRGRPARADEAEVAQYVRQSPQAFGLHQTRWTLRALAQVVPSVRGFTEVGVWKVLRRCGYGYKRGQPHLHSPDPQYGEKRGPWSRHSTRPYPDRGR